MYYRFFGYAVALATVIGCAPSSLANPSAAPAPARLAAPTVEMLSAASYVPHRVFDTRRNRFSDFEAMLADLNAADAVFLGEQHNDPGTHRLQAAVLEGVARRRSGRVVLALEMFERDVQPQLDAYLAGSLDEAAFLAQSRPWGNYAADYRPLVEFARENQWPVIAGNVPRRLAQVVARRGLTALDSLSGADRAFIARDHSCPRDEYWRRFQGVMGDMSGHGMQLSPEQLEAMVWRTYEAQCVKDEAMGEAVADALATHRTLVVHANGSFHSDYGLGTVARVERRAPDAELKVVSFVPVSDLDEIETKSRRSLGDYVVFTLAPARPAAP